MKKEKKKEKKVKTEEGKEKKVKKIQSVLHLLGLQYIVLASVISGSLDASCKAGFEDENASLFVF